MSSSRALDRVRRVVDEAMIFASLMVLAWPLVSGRMTADDRGVLDWLLPVGVVLVASIVISKTADRWPLAKYAPVSAAVVMAAELNAGDRGGEAELTWLIIAVAGTILMRQFVGARTNEGLMRDLTRQRAQLARQAFRDPLTGLGAAQASRLRALDCAQAQGYHFARPMPAAGISELLAEQAVAF